MVKYMTSDATHKLWPKLMEMGFTEVEDGFVRFCFSMCMSQAETLITNWRTIPKLTVKLQEYDTHEIWNCIVHP